MTIEQVTISKGLKKQKIYNPIVSTFYLKNYYLFGKKLSIK